MPNYNAKPPKPWKKGESGNLRGAALHNPVKKAIKRLVEADFVDLASALATGRVDDLADTVKTKKGSVIEVWLAACIVRSIQKGDFSTLDAILDRLFGKSKERLNVSAAIGLQVTTPLTLEERRAKIERLEKLKKETDET